MNMWAYLAPLRSIMKKCTTGESQANKLQRESGWQKDEDLREDIARGSYWCEAKPKLTELNAKLDKVLQAAFSELDVVKQQCKELEKRERKYLQTLKTLSV